MKNTFYKNRLTCIIVSMVVSLNSLFGQTSVKITDITDNPGKYNNELVKISGIVLQYTGNAQTTSNYNVQDDFGGQIQVNTSEIVPETFRRYEITGTVVFDQVLRRPIIIEKSRLLVEKSNDLIYYLLGAVALLLGLVIYFVLRKKKLPEGKPAINPVIIDDDFKTIIINRDSPDKTLIMIPGSFEIITGLDQGKSFRMSGFPSPEGSVITIGRENVTGEKKYSHIQLKEKTVSRKQAEIIYKEKRLFIKNLSESNLTQLNGAELAIGLLKEIQNNSVIKTGEVEFRYIAN
jgi:hypothetical protein